MKLQEKFLELRNKRQGLLATNFYNLETLQGVLMAAKTKDQPIILQLTRSSIEYMGLPVAFNLAKSMLLHHGVESWIHLDHGDSYELVAQCLDIGFDSVMIDASEKSFKENIAITSKVVKLAESYGANVEAELGYIAKLGQDKNQGGFTHPMEAKEFVEATGVDALAVAIGTSHGFYDQEPELQLDRLSEIAEATYATLVLHGGSGIPGDLLRKAVDRGICKINLATEIKNIFMQTLKYTLLSTSEIDLRKVFPIATEKVTELVTEKLEIMKNSDN
ncbi:class II fructose-bisphosphate aldolase [Confluentibacter flavum]|uniref:Ketose-bisphosphate aldolase n=1 Tax=Confluentibacter flavum TaxID=1909700 RepID=A0A2N3HHJ5_9FLAO|nr:class II fructose-bisphosphate aldolase [Confluentibacter flavum]PKQ44426.1 ketose-bisphosphate aldolase [Confluentibacter flavum]